MTTPPPDFVVCEDCNLVVRPADAFAAHLASAAHAERVQGNYARCSVCAICLTRKTWVEHIGGQSHRKKAAQQGLRIDLPPETPAVVPNHKKCRPCGMFVYESDWGLHVATTIHYSSVRARQQVDSMRNALQDASVDQEGRITISHHDGLDIGILDLSNISNGLRGELTVEVQGSSAITLVHARFPKGKKKGFSIDRPSGPSIIQPGTFLHLPVVFQPSGSNIGHYSTHVELSFEDPTQDRYFIILRSIKAVLGNQAEYEAIRPTAQYEGRQRRRHENISDSQVVPGERPAEFSRHPYATRLKQYRIPIDLEDALNNGPQDLDTVMKRLPAKYSSTILDKKTYISILKTQLWVEEYKAKIDMHIYDLFDRTLRREGHNLYLVVPGLAESRPSLILGDSVRCQPSDSTGSRWFEGVVHDLRRDEVGLRFSRSFRHSPTSTYSVQFTFNRVPLRRQHQALNRLFWEDRVFFPMSTHVLVGNATQDADLTWYNTSISRNAEQSLAVRTIISLPAGAHPFVVFGPPGTGKTVTIVETILQLVRRNTDIKILACAPSNSAADLIAERLLQNLDQAELRRFYAPSRSPTQSSAQVLACAHVVDGVFTVPTKENTMPFTIVVATCVGAAFALNTKIPPGHFDWIFIDEAGQGTEPEAIVSVKGMAGPRTNIVLSGDPKQLQAVIRSGVAMELGLGKSFLERLMQRTVYDETEGRGRTLVKLLQNFRSHPRLLQFPSRTFYGGELQPHANPAIVNMFEQWEHHPSPTRKFPIIFHSISGNDEQEASSPSYFNRFEASQVKVYVEQLLAGGLVASEDIGVITPYHAQAKKIRQLLKPSAPDVRVASVELFQGQERRVIIMSTVRSTQDLLSYDLQHSLGFVGNPRRFNVAMTRAQALLVVVGDPNVLGLDPLWRSWLNFVYLGGGWTGSAEPNWDPEAEVREAGGYDREVQELGLEEMRALTARMRSLSSVRTVLVEDDHAGAYEVEAREAE